VVSGKLLTIPPAHGNTKTGRKQAKKVDHRSASATGGGRDWEGSALSLPHFGHRRPAATGDSAARAMPSTITISVWVLALKCLLEKKIYLLYLRPEPN